MRERGGAGQSFLIHRARQRAASQTQGNWAVEDARLVSGGEAQQGVDRVSAFLKRLFGARMGEGQPLNASPNVDSSEPEVNAEPTVSASEATAAEAPQPITSETSLRGSAANAASEKVDAELFRRKFANDCAEDGITNRGGGVYINGGTINVSGDIVGGDRIIIVSDGTIDRLFEPLLTDIQTIEPETLHAEARQHLIEIRDQAKCYDINLVVVGSAIKWLAANTPGLMPGLRKVLVEACIPRSMRELAIAMLDQISRPY